MMRSFSLFLVVSIVHTVCIVRVRRETDRGACQPLVVKSITATSPVKTFSLFDDRLSYSEKCFFT